MTTRNTNNRRSLGERVRDKIEEAALKRVESFFAGPTSPRGLVAKTGADALVGIGMAIKEGDLAKAIDVALTARMTLPEMVRLIEAHPDLFPEPAPDAGIGGLVEGFLDAFFPGLLPAPDDPELRGGRA